MSITFWSDPSYTTTKTFDSMLEFYDPSKNTFCLEYPNVYTHGQIRIPDLFKILNQLYCDENILNWNFIKGLGFNGRLTDQEYANYILLSQSIPADKRWVLAFIYRDGALNSSCVFKHQTFENHDMIRNNTIIRTSNSQKATDVFSNLDDAISRIPPIIKIYEDFFETRQNIFWDTNANGAIPTVARTIVNFCANYPYCRINDEGTTQSRARDYIRAITNSNDVAIRPVISGRDLHEIIITLKVSKNFREPLYSVKNYSFDVLSILPFPLQEQKENKPLLVGVELEVCTDYTIRELVDAADEPFFCGKTDSSISGNKSRCVELVTAPASIKYLKRQYALWFNKLDYSKFDVSTQTSNGMHVHVGREHFRNELGQEDKNHIRNFCWFINNPANIDFFVYLSERGSLANMSHYTPFFPFQRGSSKFHAFKSICNTIGRGGFRGATNFKGGWDNAKTVEVRIFKGIVSYACIVKNLEVVDSVFHFTKSLTSYRDLTLKGYLAWLNSTPRNKYSVLKKFLEQVDLHKMLLSSDIKDVIFNEDNPDKIVDLLKKAPFKITNEHVTILNKGRKRTFILDKETHELKLTTINRSKISFLDKEIAARYLRAS